MLFVYKYLTGKYYCNIIFIVTTTNETKEILQFPSSGHWRLVEIENS